MTRTDQESPADPTLGHDGSVPEELSHCGAVVDKAIEYMLGEKLPPIAIASALLGGSLGLLARTMDQGTMLAMLENAMHSVRAGELHPDRDRARPAG
ncbi:hypothetical protein AAC691_00880 [Nguyenibacter vanlangensis]|uniref:Uncharacterized protein n=1 Tax=Nguyenibacter vanlangensis TaxID=1216886 RepID=A0ABZ3D5J8_9PROT